MLFKRGGIAMVLAAAFMFAGSAKADDVVTLTGIEGGSVGNVATSPYYATITDLNTSITTTGVPIICDDFLHNVYIGETWTATVNTFANPTALRFSQGTSAAQQAATIQLYDEAAFLTDAYILNPGATETQREDASFAVWAIFAPVSSILAEDPAAASLFGTTGGAQVMLTAAQGMTFAPGAYADYEVLTPSNPTSPQEYLVRTPEPSTLLLLCAGLAGLMLLARRRAFACASQV